MVTKKQAVLQQHTFLTKFICGNPKKLESLCENVVKEYKDTTWQSQYKGVLVKLLNQITEWNALSIG